jgi:hypothetical protein
MLIYIQNNSKSARVSNEKGSRKRTKAAREKAEEKRFVASAAEEFDEKKKFSPLVTSVE